MLSFSEARDLVEAEVMKVSEEAGIPCEILDSETMEFEMGWVFFYQSKAYLKTQNIRDALAGNAPYLVDRVREKLVITGTAFPTEDYIAKYLASVAD